MAPREPDQLQNLFQDDSIRGSYLFILKHAIIAPVLTSTIALSLARLFHSKLKVQNVVRGVLPGPCIPPVLIVSCIFGHLFRRVILPLLSPMDAPAGILTRLWAWNDRLLPLVVLTDQSKATLAPARCVLQGRLSTNRPVSLASFPLIAPMLVVHACSHLRVVSGVTRGSQK